MGIVNLITGLVLIALGFLVKKYPNLIAGYNTMSKEKKKNVDINGLSSFMRTGFIILGLVIIVGYYLFYWLGFLMIANISFLTFLFCDITFILIKIQQFDHNNNNKLLIYIVIIFCFINLSVLVFGFIYYGTMSSKIILSEKLITINGVYGLNKKIADIADIELIDNIPAIVSRKNGFSFNKTRKGNFELKKYGMCKLFLESKKGPYLIIIDKNSKKIIINYIDKSKTEEVFEKLQKLIEK